VDAAHDAKAGDDAGAGSDAAGTGGDAGGGGGSDAAGNADAQGYDGGDASVGAQDAGGDSSSLDASGDAVAHDASELDAGTTDATTTDSSAGDSSVSDASAPDASTPDASTLDASTPLGCGSTLTLAPLVPATGYAMFAHGDRAFVLLDDHTHWTVVQGGVATTSAIPLPASVTSMTVTETELEPDGRTLLLFTAGGGPLATFFDGVIFSAPVALPASTQSIHADAQGHMFAVDTSRVLWDGSGGAFVNRGALPIGGTASQSWVWTVAASGVVHLAYEAAYNASYEAVYAETLGNGSGSAWSASTIVVQTGYTGDTVTPRAFASAPDGSVHLVWTYGFTGSDLEAFGKLIYARTKDGATWSTPELLLGEDNYSDNNVIPGLASLVARSYDQVSALLIEMGGSMIGNYALYVQRCSEDWAGWHPVTTLPASAGSYDVTLMAANAAGTPGFLLTETSGRGVVLTQ
jgi:hypothetical protein